MRALPLAIAAMALNCRCAMADAPRPVGARLWTGADIASLDRALAARGSPFAQILQGKTYGALVLHRSMSGQPELHVKLNDFFVILSGGGEIEVGGSVTGERTVAPGEKRGETLRGGAVYRVTRGDVLFVPANHWLQVLIAKGEVLRAIIIKTQ